MYVVLSNLIHWSRMRHIGLSYGGWHVQAHLKKTHCILIYCLTIIVPKYLIDSKSSIKILVCAVYEINQWLYRYKSYHYALSVPRGHIPLKNTYHYSDVIMSILASQITGDSTVCFTVWLDQHQRKHQSPRYWSFVKGIHRRMVGSPHKGTVTRRPFPFDDVIMQCTLRHHLDGQIYVSSGNSKSDKLFTLSFVYIMLYHIILNNVGPYATASMFSHFTYYLWHDIWIE